jgi:transcriptional regulator with XRE-family HTH domain
MGDSASPLMQRRRLRTELRNMRVEKDLTQEQVAKAMEWSLSKMNRIEKAKTGISTNDLKVLLTLYGTDKEKTEDLVALARTARQSGWWRSYSDVAAPELLELIEYESAASKVRQFETMFVPGVLQTEGYASAVLQIFNDEQSAAERVSSLVALRNRRTDLLTSENAPNFFFVLDESVIHRLVGSPAVASEQLRYLVEITELPNVQVRVVPFAVGLYPGMKGSFEVVQFDDDPDEDIVFLEGSRGDVIIDDPDETGNYLHAFEGIQETALGPSESKDRLLEAAGEMA